MNASELLSAADFVAQRPELPDGGRWTELVAGQVIALEPPDMAHGTTVLNLSKALAVRLGELKDEPHGYACFDVGVLVAQNPDTVRFPAVSYFAGGAPFAEAEKMIAEGVPALTAEIASSPARRLNISSRIAEYHSAGVRAVWVIDTIEKQVHIAERGAPVKRLAEHETLWGSPVLSGFHVRVGDLFTEPTWWR